jgi:hypothetical protein
MTTCWSSQEFGARLARSLTWASHLGAIKYAMQNVAHANNENARLGHFVPRRVIVIKGNRLQRIARPYAAGFANPNFETSSKHSEETTLALSDALDRGLHSAYCSVCVRPTASSNRCQISRSWGRLPDPRRPHHVSVSPPRLLVGRGHSVSPLRPDLGRLLPYPPSLDQFLPPVALPRGLDHSVLKSNAKRRSESLPITKPWSRCGTSCE